MDNIGKPVHFIYDGKSLLTLAAQCKAIREHYSLAQHKLAGWIGTNQTEISFIERGFIPEDYSKIEEIERLYRSTIKK